MLVLSIQLLTAAAVAGAKAGYNLGEFIAGSNSKTNNHRGETLPSSENNLWVVSFD